MEEKFRVVVESGAGEETYPCANLGEAVEMYRKKMDEYPQSQIHLYRI